MSSDKLKKLAAARQLKPEPPARAELEGLVRSGRVRLKDAGVASLSLEGRFDLAYSAAHALSLAALRWHGYRSENRYLVARVRRPGFPNERPRMKRGLVARVSAGGAFLDASCIRGIAAASLLGSGTRTCCPGSRCSSRFGGGPCRLEFKLLLRPRGSTAQWSGLDPDQTGCAVNRRRAWGLCGRGCCPGGA